MDLSRIFKPEQPHYELSFLNDLSEAIIRVEEKYCFWDGQHEDHIQKIERVFCYELYHQYRLLTACKNQNNDFRIDGEIVKQLDVRPIDLLGTNINIKQEQKQFSPDLVVHLGQSYQNVENQKLIIEVKTRKVDNDELGVTILKLNHYINVLNFQYAAFISVNTDFNTVVLQLREIFSHNNVRNENFMRIIIFNYKNRILNVDRLYHILTP